MAINAAAPDVRTGDASVARISSFAFLIAAVAAPWMLSACTQSPVPEPPAAAPASQPVAGTTDAASAQPVPPPQPADDDPRSKTRWVGEIPYDVFFDEPLQVAAENNSPASTSPPLTGDTTSSEVPQPPPMPAAPATAEVPASEPGDGPDWGRLMTAEVLNDAVTQLRNALTTNLNTLANYNRNIESITNDGAILAALAAVAEVHPDAVNWQDNAKYVRDLGYQIYTTADGTGREPYDATKLPFEQIIAILNGGPPPEIESADKVPFADVADRSELMKRIKKSFDYLRTDVSTEDRFREVPDEIVREASVLASFGGLISTESYDSADQEPYRKFVGEFMQAGVDAAAAGRAGDFPAFEEARNRIQKACNDCHAEYAFGNEGL